MTVHHRVMNRDGDWKVTGSYRLPGCAISVASKTRAYETDAPERDTVRAVTILFAPSGSDIRVDDTVTLDDESMWHVWGLPTDYASPFTGWAPGMQVQLRHFQG